MKSLVLRSAALGVCLLLASTQTARAQGPASCAAVSRTVMFRVNGAPTALECSLTAVAPTCTSSGTTIAVAAGDFLAYEVSGGAESGLTGYISAVCQ